MLLIGTIFFGDKSRASVHWKFLPLLRYFGSIGQYSLGSACLPHLYRALCKASRYDCKEIDGPLTFLLVWAWIRLSYLAPVPRESRNFMLANRYLTLAHFRKAFDDLQEGQFVWVTYAVDRVDLDIIPVDIYMHSVVWSATVSLVSFECIEWHATDWYRRQFGFVQVVPHQERDLDKAHSEVRTKNDEGDQVMDDVVQENEKNEEQLPHSPPPPPPQEQPQSSSQYVFLGHEAPEPHFFGCFGRVGFCDSSRSDGGRGFLNSQNPYRVSMSLIEKNAKTLEQKIDECLVDEPDDKDFEEDEDEDMDEDEEPCNDASNDGDDVGEPRTPYETGKGYNLRVDPPRRSANRFTPSVFKKVAKKCKNFVKDLTDDIYYGYVPQPHIAYIAVEDATFASPSRSGSTSSWGLPLVTHLRYRFGTNRDPL
ncbi:hypothetical protein Ahy_A04g019526 [Arachis hypogaea]|uniref:Aminotransferase-like plant mobile domain-containing protein n=1 Tax=Arachis hypogaea TaxID=3818 RepID=A0A445DGA6_ARAHY|nr:hypothetical protein Ahy_A04g019526 [Arachis hypogaea]